MTPDSPQPESWPSARQFVLQHPGVLAGVVPLVLVGLRILWDARGDSAALAAMVASTDLTQVLLSTFTTLAPTVLSAATAFFVATRISDVVRNEESVPWLRPVLAPLIVMNSLVAFAQPFWIAVAALFLLGALLVVEIMGDLRRRYLVAKGKDPEESKRSSTFNTERAVFFFSFLFLGIFMQQPPLQPAEDLTLGKDQPRTAFVLEETSERLKVIWATGSVAYVELEMITKREPCRATSKPFLASIPAFDDSKEEAPPRCTTER